MVKVSKHDSTSDLSRRLCDILLTCFSQADAPRLDSSTKYCGVHIRERRAALYWALHSKNHIQVYLSCEETQEIRNIIEHLLPKGVTLQTRPFPRNSNWAKSTPFSFYIETEEQAQSMGPLLKLLSTYRTNSPGVAKSTTHVFWHPPSESADAEIDTAEEGTGTSVLVNKYERSVKNRNSCIQRYKAICSVCGFDLSVAYGEIGEGYIHVHHLTPLSASKGKSRKVDLIKDLRPVCPNCHEMLHRTAPPYTIEKLQEIMAAGKAMAD